jgi:hypothetical protein
MNREMYRTSGRSQAILEALEDRTLQAAQPTFDFGRLTGYGLAGHSWTYQTDYTMKSNVISGQSGSTNATVSVGQQGSGSAASYKVTTSGVSGQSTTMFFQKDGNGTNIVEIEGSFGLGNLTFHLANTRLAPRSLGLGGSYADTGTFTGQFSGSSGSTKVSGTISGSTSASIKLSNQETVTVPAGTFKAVKGAYNISLNGTLKMRLDGQTYNVGISASYPMTFWAVQDLGMVKSQGKFSTALVVEGERASVSLTDTSVLEDYSPRLGKTALAV